MIRPFLGAEFLDDLPVAPCLQERLERGIGRRRRLRDLSAAFLPPLFEQRTVSVVLRQPGRRTTLQQFSLDILSVTQERTEAGLQTVLGRPSGSEGAGMDLQRLLFTTLTELFEGRDSGSESFHRNVDGSGERLDFKASRPR